MKPEYERQRNRDLGRISRREFLKWAAGLSISSFFLAGSGSRIYHNNIAGDSEPSKDVHSKEEVLTLSKQNYHDSQDPLLRSMVLRENVEIAKDNLNKANQGLRDSEGGDILYYLKYPVLPISFIATLYSGLQTVIYSYVAGSCTSAELLDKFRPKPKVPDAIEKAFKDAPSKKL